MKDDFLWGVATSAYQSEGGYNGAGEPHTNWAEAEARGDVARCGTAAEFWTRYEEDFARCRQLGLNAFRMGIEWSRVQPTRTGERELPPEFDYLALDHYAEMLMACRSAGLEPVVTLHHFVHPAWLGPDPWLEPVTAGLFVKYVTTTVTYVNSRLVARRVEPLRIFITINEPNMLVINTYIANMFPTGGPVGVESVITAYNTLLTAHVHAYNAIHDLYATRGWAAPRVTLNNYCSDLYWSDKVLLDLLSLAEREVPREEVGGYLARKAGEFRANFDAARITLRKDVPYYFGTLLKRVSDWLGKNWFVPARLDRILDAIYASPRRRLFDYLGIDYYDPFSAHAFRVPVLWDHEFKNKSFHSWIMNSVTSKWWDWRVLPRGLHFFCEYYTRDFGGRDVLIAENGMALRRRWDNQHSHRRDRITRSEFLRLHVHEVTRILNDGIPLIGYLHWSLFDNYEWGSYTPRFGLFALDYARGTERLVPDHLGDRASETYAALIREARENYEVSSASSSSMDTVPMPETTSDIA
ncbi:MAG: beta-glucosidase [Chthoniobacter sp.]|jgi:beta-glucosidase/6-phospho-beta-glucosidase/beta-galactosidase|nr:beta-glucosidase [Chthoniobacter sp.]